MTFFILQQLRKAPVVSKQHKDILQIQILLEKMVFSETLSYVKHASVFISAFVVCFEFFVS